MITKQSRANKPWTAKEQEIMKVHYPYKSFDYLVELLGRTKNSIRRKGGLMGLSRAGHQYVGDFAIYKGDEMLSLGTIKEIADELNVKEETIKYYMTPVYKGRLAERNSKNAREIVTLD